MNSTKWTQSAVKRKAFEHGAKSMVRESAIGVVEIARCLLSKQAKSAGPQRTTLPCFWHVADLPLLTCRTRSCMLNKGGGKGLRLVRSIRTCLVR